MRLLGRCAHSWSLLRKVTRKNSSSLSKALVLLPKFINFFVENGKRNEKSIAINTELIKVENFALLVICGPFFLINNHFIN